MVKLTIKSQDGKLELRRHMIIKLKQKHISRFKTYLDDIANITKVENFWKAFDDDFKGWHVHHRYGIEHSGEWLRKNGLYYHRPHFELIFLTASDHIRLHKNSRKNLKI